MSSIASTFLAELSDVGVFLQGLPNIRSPVTTGASDSTSNVRLERPSSAASSNRSPSVSRQNTPSLEMSLNEKGKSRGKGRVLKAVGDLYLLSGRLNDAISKYLEALTILRADTDHLWHANCLESIGVCYFQFARLQIDFQVSSQLFPFYQHTHQPGPLTSSPSRETPSILAFPEVLLELHEFVHNLYIRSTNYGNETPPPICHLDFLQRSLSLNCILLGSGDNIAAVRTLGKSDSLMFTHHAKSQLMSFAMRLYEPRLFQQVSLKSQIGILWNLAYTFATLGYHRKERFFLRELLTVLTPSMVQARVHDAADKGLHPSTGFLLSETERDGSRTLIYGVYDLMEQICESYDVTEEALSRQMYNTSTFISRDWISLKILVLRDCILLSESIPDIDAIVSFHISLLRLARTHMSHEDQNRIKNGLIRAINLGKRIGRPAKEGLYWDPYLLQIIIPNPIHASRILTKHTTSEIAEAVISDPFIYNPFAKQIPQNLIPILAQQEAFEATVTLNNPYAFETEIEAIRLIAEGITYEAPPTSTVIPAESSSQVRLRLIPTSSGHCRVTSCSIKVWACREQRFMFLGNQSTTNLKEERKFNASSRSSLQVEKDANLQILVNFIEAVVIPPQPFLTIDLEGIPRTLLLLEGEESVFRATLTNESATAATMVVFTLQDSVADQFHQYESQQINEIDLFYLESYLHKHQVFALADSPENIEVMSHSNRQVKIRAFGKRGLTGGRIQVDYGILEKVRAPSVPIYTRQTALYMAITVHPSVKITVASILPLNYSESRTKTDSTADEVTPFVNYVLKIDDRSLYCVALMDIHNHWSQAMNVALQSKNGGKQISESRDNNIQEICSMPICA